MSKISYCSLEEAWGQDFLKLKQDKFISEKNNNSVQYNSQLLPLDYNKNNLNSIEHINKIKNNIIDEDKEYDNRINKNLSIYNNEDTKLIYDNNENNKVSKNFNINESDYNKNLNIKEKEEILNDIIESFQNKKENFTSNQNYKSDILELIILIVIGLLIIFVLDSVYKIGKSVGLKMSR